mmetsp:Transcript_4999/g.11688  ORF Transcript_4999/g.11688 Transcript_4999/m.11688 type:complete len:392 (-) Transcript_4999:298-1473(-)
MVSAKVGDADLWRALAGDLDGGAGLCAGWDPDGLGAVDDLHIDRLAQDGVGVRDGGLRKDGRPLAREAGVRTHLDKHKQVSRFAPVHAGVALPLDAQLHALLHTSRHSHVNLFGPLHEALSVARRARVREDLAHTATSGTRRSGRYVPNGGPLLLEDHALSVAGGAYDRFGAGRGAGPHADLTRLHVLEPHLLRPTKHGSGEVNLQLHLQITAATRCPTTPTAGHAAAKECVEYVVESDLLPSAGRLSGHLLLLLLLLLLGGGWCLAGAVVDLSPGVVSEDLVGLVELHHDVLVAAEVGVKLAQQILVPFGDFFLGCPPVDPEDLVVVLGHRVRGHRLHVLIVSHQQPSPQQIRRPPRRVQMLPHPLQSPRRRRHAARKWPQKGSPVDAVG